MAAEVSQPTGGDETDNFAKPTAPNQYGKCKTTILVMVIIYLTGKDRKR